MVVQRLKWFIVLLVVLLAAPGCVGGASQENATPTPIPTPIVPTKPTYEVRRGEVIHRVDFSGRIAPVVERELFFRASGYVGAVYVERDDWVEEGDVLAELEVVDLKNQLLQAEASLEAAISNNEQRIVEAEANLRAAELRLAITKADDPAPQVTIAEVDLERAQTALADAQEEYDKAIHRYWEPDTVQDAYARALRNAELNLMVAEARYQQALQARQIYLYNVQIQEQEVALARLSLERLETGLDIEEIRLNVERLKAQLDDARLIAPFDGQVLSVRITKGRAVEGHQTAVIVADPSDLEVSADLATGQMEDLAEGMAATVAATGRPDETVPGFIRRLPYPYGGGGRVGSEEEEDKSTRVTLEVAAEESGYEIGDLVRVTVIVERKADVLFLPPQAIRSFEGRRFVVVQESGGQRRVDVQVGIEGVCADGKECVEIESVTGDLAEGQIVIGQ